MKKHIVFFVIFLCLMLVSTIGCKKEEENINSTPTSPEDVNSSVADWFVCLLNGVDRYKVVNYVTLHYLKNVNIPTSSDEIIVKINGNPIDMVYNPFMPGYYDSQVDMTPGQEYQIFFSYNGTTLLNTTLKACYPSSVNFPDTYNPTQSAYVNWTVGGNNQYQVIGVSSYKYTGTDIQSDDWSKQLANTVRSYNIPANAVDNFGTETEYYIWLDQLNYKLVNRIAAMTYYYNGADYSKNSSVPNIYEISKRAEKVFLSLR